MNHSKLEGIASVLLMLLVFSIIAHLIQYSVLVDKQEEIENLNNTVEQVVQMHNEKNHELNTLQYECDILRDANEQLIKHSTPSSVNKAILATPLPKMKG